MPREVAAQCITREAFAPFGDLVSAGLGPGATANQGTAIRSDFCARLENTRADAEANLAVFRSMARTLPVDISLLERHPASTQTFLPMICTRYLVCVAPPLPDGAPDVARVLAFVCDPGQGISYHRGTWHHPIVALDGTADFVMLAWEAGTSLDCQEHPLGEPVRVVWRPESRTPL